MINDMAVVALVSVAEYLNRSYRPDCDYIEGELRERNLGEFEHSSAQAEIIVWLRTHYSWLVRRVLSEQRVQVKTERFRIPDVCVIDGSAPGERITRTPPVLCIEILSRDDRMSEIMERVDDYFQMGGPVCWIIDPVRGHGWIATSGQLSEPADGILRAGEIEMPVAEVVGSRA
jgi:Uma2 family endonuclease